PRLEPFRPAPRLAGAPGDVAALRLHLLYLPEHPPRLAPRRLRREPERDQFPFPFSQVMGQLAGHVLVHRQLARERQLLVRPHDSAASGWVSRIRFMAVT